MTESLGRFSADLVMPIAFSTNSFSLTLSIL
jgi:hypothetical protein